MTCRLGAEGMTRPSAVSERIVTRQTKVGSQKSGRSSWLVRCHRPRSSQYRPRRPCRHLHATEISFYSELSVRESVPPLSPSSSPPSGAGSGSGNVAQTPVRISNDSCTVLSFRSRRSSSSSMGFLLSVFGEFLRDSFCISGIAFCTQC